MIRGGGCGPGGCYPLIFFDFFSISLGTPPPKQTQAYGQRAAGTHPTGTYPCSFIC